MLDIYKEFKAIIAALEEKGIDYAVCGGFGMAIHGFPRATVDIDLLIRAERIEEARSVVRDLGYNVEAQPMTFYGGAIEIRRWSKIDPQDGDLLTVDFLLVTPAIEEAWSSRINVASAQGGVWVVSREGLIKLKSFRRSGQDLDDVQKLRGDADES